MLDVSRRHVLIGLIAAPAVIAYSSLMPVHNVPKTEILYDMHGKWWRRDGAVWQPISHPLVSR